MTRVAVGDRVAGTYFPRWADGRLTPDLARDQLGCAYDGLLAEYATLDAEWLGSSTSDTLQTHTVTSTAGPLSARSSSTTERGPGSVPRETRRLQTSLEQLLAAHRPNPALVIDAEWNLVAANSAAAVLWEGVDATLLEGTVNVLRVMCHPDGLSRTAIVSPACSAGLLRRLRRQASDREDDALLDLVAEMEAHLAERGVDPAALAGTPGGGVAAPITLRTRAGDVRLLTVIATLGAPLEVTAGDLALETFLPVDAESAARLARVTPMVISDPAPMTESSCNFSWSSVPGVAV